MKKYLALGIGTLALLFLILAIPEMMAKALPAVKVTSMKTDLYAEAVYVSGSVEEAEKTDVSSKFPLILDKVRVSAGERVSAGDVLMTVDRAKTESFLLEYVSDALDTGEGDMTLFFLELLGEYAGDRLKELVPAAVTAPVSGIVSRVCAPREGLFLPGESLAVLSESGEKKAILNVPETEIGRVRPGQRVELSGISPELPSAVGRVEAVAPAARKQLSGTSFETVVDVTVALEDPPEALAPGYTVKAAIFLEEPRQVNLLPYEAVGRDEEGREYVYLYEAATASAVRRFVESGAETANGVEIVKGVYPSDVVVFDVSTVSGGGGLIRVQGRVG